MTGAEQAAHLVGAVLYMGLGVDAVLVAVGMKLDPKVGRDARNAMTAVTGIGLLMLLRGVRLCWDVW